MFFLTYINGKEVWFMAKEVVIISAVRTAIGTFQGSLKDVPATTLGSAVFEAAIGRANIQR